MVPLSVVVLGTNHSVRWHLPHIFRKHRTEQEENFLQLDFKERRPLTVEEKKIWHEIMQNLRNKIP